MTLILALDIGKRRTGMALGDDEKQFVMALDTVHHTSDSELIGKIISTIKQRNIGRLVVGLPLLPDGSDGEQSCYVRELTKEVEIGSSLTAELVDERYTTPKAKNSDFTDPDAKSACSLLEIALAIKNR